MAEASLIGTKTCTRRICPPGMDKDVDYSTTKFGKLLWRNRKCPYGYAGDILEVKEAYYAYGVWRKFQKIEGGKDHYKFEDQTKLLKMEYMYPVGDGPKPTAFWNKCKQAMDSNAPQWHLRSSLFMPKKAIRQRFEITSVTIERLHDITEEDAKMEGIIPLAMSSMQILTQGQRYLDYTKEPSMFNEGLRPLKSFKSLWTSINGADSWNENPYVWVIKFKKI